MRCWSCQRSPGRTSAGQGGSRTVLGLMRTHFRWMNTDAPSTRKIEKTISVVLAYWSVPIVILLFWARYLTVQDLHGTMRKSPGAVVDVCRVLLHDEDRATC